MSLYNNEMLAASYIDSPTNRQTDASTMCTKSIISQLC